MFTVGQRDAFRERMLEQAVADDRIVAGAVVGSLAVDTADRYSDVDLTFGIRDGVEVGEVLEDWTRRLVAQRPSNVTPRPRSVNAGGDAPLELTE